jgi:hypothetical protein
MHFSQCYYGAPLPAAERNVKAEQQIYVQTLWTSVCCSALCWPEVHFNDVQSPILVEPRARFVLIIWMWQWNTIMTGTAFCELSGVLVLWGMAGMIKS